MMHHGRYRNDRDLFSLTQTLMHHRRCHTERSLYSQHRTIHAPTGTGLANKGGLTNSHTTLCWCCDKSSAQLSCFMLGTGSLLVPWQIWCPAIMFHVGHRTSVGALTNNIVFRNAFSFPWSINQVLLPHLPTKKAGCSDLSDLDVFNPNVNSYAKMVILQLSRIHVKSHQLQPML